MMFGVRWVAFFPVFTVLLLGLGQFGFAQNDEDECFVSTPVCDAPRLDPARRIGPTTWIRNWNRIATDADAADHSSRDPDQLGPARSSRALAIVHIAMADVTSAIRGGFTRYTTDLPNSPAADLRAAIARTAHDTLAILYPKQSGNLRNELDADLAQIPDGQAKTDGIALGAAAARAILAARDQDGSDHEEPPASDFASDEPGRWRVAPDSALPIAFGGARLRAGEPIALGGLWSGVNPFVLESSRQFRTPVPPALRSLKYPIAYTEAKLFGGDGEETFTLRTPGQTVVGIYWGYDGTPQLGTPPRLYNQIAVQIARERRTAIVDLARLLALVNVAMADTGIAVWESKYFYRFWRPITGIREEDGNPLTIRDSNFTPLGAPASNQPGISNFTPPFPAYPSGHAGFGGALFQTLRHFYRTDNIAFTFVSDEFNGVTRDNQGNVRPRLPRSFRSLSQAEEENGQSRIYLGIHWAFDKTAGISQGRNVADFVFANSFRPTAP